MIESLARIFSYPSDDYKDAIVECQNLAGSAPAAPGDEIDAFAARVLPMSLTELQELYTRTFDLNPIACLEIGWHLYGENYERGEFMVKVRDSLRRHGISETTELPDHLSHVLLLISRMEEEDRRQFASIYLEPALKKIIGEIEGKSNPFEALLKAVERAVGTFACSAVGGRV